MPLVRRTRATFRSAEFGFFGVRVMTCRQTPRRCGAPRPSDVVCFRVFSVRRSAGALTFLIDGFRPLRTSWLMVGNENLACESRMSTDCGRGRARGAHGDPWRRPIWAAHPATHGGTHEGVPKRDTERGV